MGTPVNLFGIGKSGLMVSKHSLHTTGHNIANVNSEGYSRQTVEQASGPTIPNGKLTFGTGAWAKKVARVNDEYLDRRIGMEAKNFANLEEKQLYLSQTEQIFNESNSEGINQLATKFFNEFRKLSTDPGNAAIRASVREASNQLVDDIRRVARSLHEVQKNIDDRVGGYVRDVNALAQEIRDLNLLIDRAEAGGGSAPDLHDKRDLAMKKLGAMADISAGRDQNGRVTVTMAGHVPLVVGAEVTELEVLRTPADPLTGKPEERLDIVVNSPVPVVVTDKIKTGRLGGLLEIRDQDVVDAQNKMDRIAFALSTAVNEIHRQGYGIDGGTGRNYFKPLAASKDAAELLQISDEINNNLDAIASARAPNSPSDNRIAIAMSGLGGVKGLVEGDAEGSLLDLYNGMVSEVAVKTAAAERGMVFQQDVLTQLDNVRESIVGVSLDEETSNLVQFQHAYAANAKVLQVADELLQTVLTTFK
ncbi:MAG: flagellar hook-associated protein FlgK [Bdellovibrionales bacterium]|nr:flagellar hook-associated protein FlgK [Bdellovibrionales bacterium]